MFECESMVTPDGGEPRKFCEYFLEGYLVVFPAGMMCNWDVHQVVRKHYHFGD